jgi:acyl carrier protein
MTAISERDSILGVIRNCLAESMAINPSTITLTSRLVEDLGVDSLDLFELIFTLEKSLAVRLQGGEIAALAKLEFSRDRLTPEGYLLPTDVAQLAEWLPALATSEERFRLRPHRRASFITVESLVILVERRRAGR